MLIEESIMTSDKINFENKRFILKDQSLNFIKMKQILLLSLTLLLSASLFAQRDFSKIEVTATKVVDNIYMLQGSGGNIGICIGEDGVFMIDDQFAPLSDKIKAAIAELSECA